MSRAEEFLALRQALQETAFAFEEPTMEENPGHTPEPPAPTPEELARTAEEQRQAAERAVRRVLIHGRREIMLPDDMIVRGPDGRLARHPMAGSYAKGANAASAGRGVQVCPYHEGADREAWLRGWASLQET